MERIRTVCDAIELCLRADGDAAAAAILNAARAEDVSGPEELLVLRSALVRTRSSWEGLIDVDVVADGRSVLIDAKRYAVETPRIGDVTNEA